MTTTPETPDPFASPTGNQQTPQPPIAPPGYAPMVPPSYTPITVASAVPTKLAMWAIIMTGAYAATSLLTAVVTPATVESLKKSLENPENASPFAGQNPITALSAPISIASFVLLALWMSKIRTARKARGEAISGPPAVEWWGWFVPLANIVLPFLGMRAITKGRASMGLLLGWWTAFLASSALGVASSLTSLRGIDFNTGKLAHPEVLDSMTPFAWAAGFAMLVSWVFLALIIRVTTSREAQSS